METIDNIAHPQEDNKKFKSDWIKWVMIGLFVVGLIFKNRHWPGAGLMLVACGGTSAIFVIAQFAEAVTKQQVMKGLFGVSLGLTFLYLVFRFQYWPGGVFVLGPSLLLAFGVAVYLGFQKRAQEVNRFTTLMICIGMFIYFVPNSSLYYSVNMSKTLNNYEHYHVAHAWERYGDFLQSEGKEKEAAMAYMKSFTIRASEEGGGIYEELLDDIMKE